MPLTVSYTSDRSPSPSRARHRRSSSSYVSFSGHTIYVTDHMPTSTHMYTCSDAHCREHCPFDACIIAKCFCKPCKLERDKTLCRLTDARYRDLEDKLKKKEADHKTAMKWLDGKDDDSKGSQTRAFKKVVDDLNEGIQELEEKIKNRREHVVE